MPAVGAAIGLVGVAKVDVVELELEVDELLVATGADRDDELLVEVEVLATVDETAVLLDEEELLLEELASAEVEVPMGVEELADEGLLMELLEDVLKSVLVLVALELVDDNDGELLLGVTVLLADD